MCPHKPQSLSRHFVSSAISYALMILLCAPFASLEAASRKGNARNESNTATNVPAAPAQSRQWGGELIDVSAFARPSFGDRLKPKSDRFTDHANTLKASANKLF